MFETPVEGGEVGELNAKILGQQFKDLKYGDRFFYNHERKTESHIPGLGPKLRENVFRYRVSQKTLQRLNIEFFGGHPVELMNTKENEFFIF